VERANQFIENVGESAAVRIEAGEAIKTVLTSQGNRIKTDELVNLVDSIVEKQLADALAALSALKKSDHTYTHCLDVGAIFFSVYNHWIETKQVVSKFADEADILLSAILHDIGKTALPTDILESKAKFDPYSPEMMMMREHPQRGSRILEKLKQSSTAVNMALYHHVKMNTTLWSSYPPVGNYQSVLMETRLLAVVDMFQALVGRRPYKKSWHPADAMKYIDQMAGIECDPNVWVAFREALGWYPIGALVQLNDGSKAFVVERAHNGLHRPTVIVARNAADEELTHNSVIDLGVEKDVFIAAGLDQFKVYGDHTLDRFVQLRAS